MSASYSPLSVDVLADPFPAYAELRSECPVHYDGDTGIYSVCRHSDIVDILRHPKVWSNRHGPGIGFAYQSRGDTQPRRADRAGAVTVFVGT
ncbi:MAG: hypothetical protein ACP5P1_03220 [Acidimicrobiales bacterium]